MTDAPSLTPFRRALGATGLTVSPLGLGTVKLGRNLGVKYPEPFEIPGDADTSELLRTASALGINLIDTAPAYGDSEARLGKLLPGARDDWVIVTKAGEEFEGRDLGVSRFDFSSEAIRASVHRSLQRLGTDVLDVVLLHSDGRDEEIIRRSGAPEALECLKAEGAIRAWGVSTKTPAGARLAVESGAGVIMVTLNPTHTSDLPAIELAHERGVGVLVKKALVSGHVSSASDGPTPALTPEACLDFALSVPGVSSAVVGTINPEHLRHNVATTVATLTSRTGARDAHQ